MLHLSCQYCVCTTTVNCDSSTGMDSTVFKITQLLFTDSPVLYIAWQSRALYQVWGICTLMYSTVHQRWMCCRNNFWYNFYLTYTTDFINILYWLYVIIHTSVPLSTWAYAHFKLPFISTTHSGGTFTIHFSIEVFQRSSLKYYKPWTHPTSLALQTLM